MPATEDSPPVLLCWCVRLTLTKKKRLPPVQVGTPTGRRIVRSVDVRYEWLQGLDIADLGAFLVCLVLSPVPPQLVQFQLCACQLIP